MSSHVCQCIECDSGLAPTGPKEGEHHCAVRFGSWGNTESNDKWQVFLDGVEKRFCIEAVAGEKGRIFRFEPCSVLDPDEFPSNAGASLGISDGPHICKKCGQGACAVWEFGNVDIKKNGVSLAPAEEEVNVG